MKNRILSLFLALALMLTLLPAVATTANATEYSSSTTPVSLTSLKAGDTIRKGVILQNNSITVYQPKCEKTVFFHHETDTGPYNPARYV